MNDITLITSFTAGIVSFFAPCTFVILPLFISYLSNLAVKKAKLENFSKEIIFSTIVYTLGFSFFFALLGMTANLFGSIFFHNKILLKNISIVFLIIIGTYIIFEEKINISHFSLKKIKLPDKISKQKSYFTPLLFGIISAISFSPCIGPILGSMLVLAGTTTNSAYEGGLLLFIYALGINLPLILIAIFIQSAKPLITKISKYTNIIQKIFGVFLIIYGILML